MSNYYIAATLGTGTESDPIRPDVPAGVSWVGQPGLDNTYLIKTAESLPVGHSALEVLPTQPLAEVCETRGLNLNDVLNKWRAG